MRQPRITFSSAHATCIFVGIIMMISSVSGFSTNLYPSKRMQTAIKLTNQERNPSLSNCQSKIYPNTAPFVKGQNPYRTKFGNLLTGAMTILTIAMTFPPLPSNAGLLDDYGNGLTINSSAPKAEVKEPTKVSTTSGNVQIDPTLRGSYYYPTAKKRYLPRILKASDALNALPTEISTATKSVNNNNINNEEEYNWDRVLELVAMVDDAVLPLQLYQSSLTGQGLSLNNDYAAKMKNAALRYERSAKQLTTVFQTNKKNFNPNMTKMIASNIATQEKIQSILNELKDAMNEYRIQGRLTDADNLSIPPATPEEMRRMAMRSKPTSTIP